MKLSENDQIMSMSVQLDFLLIVYFWISVISTVPELRSRYHTSWPY